MKERYFYSRKTTDSEKRFRKIDSTLYPKIEPGDDDIIIVTKLGDRLDLLAFRYYGDVTLWWIIAQANQIGKGTLNIPAGTTLRIPQTLENVYAKLETINRTR